MKMLSCILIYIILVLNHHLIVAQQDDGLCNQDLSTFLPPPFNNVSGLTCKTVWNNFVLRYVEEKNNVMTIILSAAYTSGWVGMGFSKDGTMVGSSAMVGWIGKGGKAVIKQYYLRGITESQVIPNAGELQLTTIPPAVILNQATIYLAFQIQLQTPLRTQSILLAFSNKDPRHNRLTKHVDKTSINFNFNAGGGSFSTNDGGGGATSLSKLLRNHGLLGIIGWGVLLPVGAIIARYCRHKDPLWYYLHIGIQFVGFVFGIATVLLGKQLYDILNGPVPIHRAIGIFVLVLTILQILAFFVRPDTEAKIRRYWNWYHHWVGRIALFLAAINIYLGIKAANQGSLWSTTYLFIALLLFITVIVLEVMQRNKSPKTTPPPPTFQDPI